MNLTALQHSPFLQSLGWAIANSLWQAAALWIAYILVNGMYKEASAKFKNNLSTILLSSAFIWFCLTLFNKYFSIESLPDVYQVEYSQVNNSTTIYSWNDLLNKIAGILPYLSVAYLLLLIFLSIRLINIYRFTSFVKYNGLQKPAVEWKLFTEKVARHMGITRKIKLWVSHHIDVPATIGFIKPVILIPLASVNHLSADQLEAIILHELSHIKRNDYIINLFISIIETILFFNPFVVLLAKIIKRERENCCDDFVIQYQYDRHAYASALLSLEQCRNINLKLAIGATSGKKQLLLRVKRIMEINSNANLNYGQKLVALFLITGIICSVAWLSPQNNEKKKQTIAKRQEKQINSNANFETSSLKKTDNKIKSISVKSSSKKELISAELQSKELRDLNLKEIAERESNRLDVMLQDSKKEISNKRLEKINKNKFFIARGASYTPSLFLNKEMPGSFFNPALADAELVKQQTDITDLQNLPGEWEKAQFYFSIDCDKMKRELKEVFNQKLLMHLQQSIKNAVFEKFMKIKDLRPGEKAVMNTISGAPAVYNDRSFYFADSISAAQIKSINHSMQIVENEYHRGTKREQNLPAREPRSDAYVYSYGGNENIAIDENSPKRISKIYNRSNGPKVMPAPITPGALHGFRFRILSEKDNNSSPEIYIPKTPHNNNNLRVEYRNGIVYINGKEVALPDTNEIFAQLSLKGKKLQSKIKDINIEIND